LIRVISTVSDQKNNSKDILEKAFSIFMWDCVVQSVMSVTDMLGMYVAFLAAHPRLGSGPMSTP
jgi:hypothetical protein